jgi:predicted NUDIX family NTP pyrophosphohydrolase
MSNVSAGLLLYRVREDRPEVLLVHLGGPFWAHKDSGAWFLPKGEVNPEEELLSAARREFQEETGINPGGEFFPLGSIRQKSGKIVHAWAFRGDCDPGAIRSNTFTLEWPPRSGLQRQFPEVDRCAFFTVEQAKGKMHPAELKFLLRLKLLLAENNPPAF